MVVASAEQRLCACYKEQQEFHKVVDLKDAGLVIYCHSLCREGVNRGGVVGSAVTTSQDVCVILHNTKDVKVTPEEIIPALEKHDISCPRCRKLFEHAQKLLQNVKSVDKQNAMGVCDHCLEKAQSKKPCDQCSETVKKFLSLRDEKKEEMKRYLKLWLSKMRHIVKDVVTEKTKKAKPRAHSELQIDRLCQSSPKVMRQPEVKQMFHPELHKSDSNLYVDFDLEEKDQRLRKSVLFNEAVDPFAVTPYEKGVVDTYRQGPSVVESDISFYGSEHDLQDSILRSKIEIRSQRKIVHEIPKIAPWEQEALEKKDDSLIVKEVTLKLKRDPSSRGVSPHDSSGISDKGPSSIYLKVTPRKRHMPTPESDSEKSRSTDHGELGEPKRKKKMESTTDIKGAKRKHMAGEFEHPYSEQYKHEKEEFSKMSKKAHDTERLPKTLKRLEYGHLTDDEVKLQHKIPKLSHATEKSEKSLVSKSSIRRKKPKHEQDTVENILQKQFSYFFPKSMEKEAKKPPKIGAPSSQLIRTTHEKIRQQAEEEKKRHEQERQRKLEEKEKKRLEKEEKKKEAQAQKKQAEVEKRLADEEKRKRAAEEELIQKAMIEEEKKKSEEKGRKESLKKDLASKHDQKEKKIDDSGKDLKQKVDVKGKAIKDQEKDLKTKPEIKAKAATKDKVEEPDKTKKDLKAKADPKGKVEEIDKTQKDKSKPEASKAKPATKDKVEETEKAKKDKPKPEPTVKPGPKDKEKEKTEPKVKPESKGKTDLKDEDKEKAKKDGKVKSEAKPERVDVTESAKKDGKMKSEAKPKTDRVDVTESAKKDKAKAEQKVKTDLKERAEETESAKKDKTKAEQKVKTDLKKRAEETESAKKDKTKAEQKVKTDLKKRAEETESAKSDKAKSDIKDKDEVKLQKEIDREEQRRKAREEREQSKQDREEQAKKDREEREKSKEDRDEPRKQDREEKEKSKQDRDEQAKKDREEREKSKQDREEQRKQEREDKEKSKQARAEQDEKDRAESEKSKQEREERRKQAREEKEKSKQEQDEQDEREREEREKSKQDRDEQAQKVREEKEKSKEAEKLQKEKEAASKKKQDFKGESESSDKKGKESKEGKEKPLDFKGMKVDKGELSEPAAMTKGISAKAPDVAKVKEGPLKKEDKAKDKPSKAQDKSSKVREEKEKPLDMKGIKIDKGEPPALAVSVGTASKDKTKDISLKLPELPELPTLKEGPLTKEDKVKEKPSKAQDKSSKVSEEKEDKLSTKKEKKEDTGEAQFRKLQAERQKEKELLNKKQKQEEAELQKARDMAEKKAREDAEKAKVQIREAIATPRPEPPRPPPPPKLERKRSDEPAIEVKMNQVKVQNASVDDLILRLVTIKQTNIDLKTREKPYNLDPGIIKAHKCHHEIGSKNASSCELCKNSELEIDVDSYENQVNIKSDMEIIIGEKIFKYRAPLLKKEPNEIVPLYFQSKYEVAPVPVTPETVPSKPEISELTKKPEKDAKGVEPEPGKGIIRYALSDRTFIDKGWTMLPTEKVVRKMNVYRMRPAHPEFDWFEHNKNKRLMTYDTGERLAEFDDNGRGRWYYRNGRLALDYYDAEETNAQQRFVIYSSGEPDERGRSHPITILATFDYLGNGIVFDHAGKIRLKYNQTEGVVLDRGIGPVSHWKWHTLNDPPVLQQVMIDTQMAHKDPQIIKLGTAADNKIRPDNEEMLAIEFDNFIKEKSKKLSQKFKPFQIKMKALKINEHFSLKVLDQATVYLIFRDGSTNLKLNIGMILDHQEIVDTDTAEVGEVSNNLERFPARTDSLAGLQRSVAYAQRYERTRTERERRLRPAEPCESADQLTAAASPPLRLPLRTVPTGSTSSAANCRCRKPTNNLYYNTRLL